MTNPMLAELDEVVRLSERAAPGKVELHTSCSWRRIVAERGRPFLVPTIDPDRHQNMDTTESAEFVVALVNWFRTHHAALADMAKRLEAAERKCGACPNSEQAAAAYREYMSLNDDDADKAKQDLGTLVMGWHAAMTIDATQEGEG